MYLDSFDDIPYSYAFLYLNILVNDGHGNLKARIT